MFWRLRILTLTVVVGLVPIAGWAQPPSQFPSATGTTVCDCRPEFNTSAEAQGTCEVAKDDTKWCNIKFNNGTGERTARQQEYLSALKGYGLPTYDNVGAAVFVNKTSPDKWDVAFVQKNLPALIAVALWDVAPERMKATINLLSSYDNARLILSGFQTRQGDSQSLKLGAYQATASWGCLELVQGQFSVVIKTVHSAANLGCKYVKK